MLRTSILASLSLLLSSCVVGEFDDEVGDGDLSLAGKANATIRVVTHNVWKQPSAIQRAINKAEAIDADVIALQELCPGQKDAIVNTYGSQWSIGVVAANRPALGGCPLPDGSQEVPFDLVAFRGKGGTPKAYDSIGGPERAPGNKLVCVKFERGGVPVHACSVHLISADWTDPVTGIAYNGEAVRQQQATGLKRIAQDWFSGNQNHFGILAGDFNSGADQDPMDKIYSGQLGGSGDFVEYNRNGNSRNGRVTVDKTSRKIDYIFFSANRAPVDGEAVDIIETDSDHHMVVSTVKMKK